MTRAIFDAAQLGDGADDPCPECGCTLVSVGPHVLCPSCAIQEIRFFEERLKQIRARMDEWDANKMGPLVLLRRRLEWVKNHVAATLSMKGTEK